MTSTKTFLTYEGFILALAPVAGVLSSYFYQVGRYTFYSVPYDLIELSTPRIIVASVSVLMISSVYAVSWLSNIREDGRWKLPGIIGHITYNSILTGAFWFRADGTVSEMIPVIILCITGTTVGTYWLQRTITRWTDRGGGRILSRYLCAVYLFFVFALLAAYSGYSNASGDSHLAIVGSNSVVGGTFNGNIVTKGYEPKSGEIEADVTTIVSPSTDISLRTPRIRLKHPD